MKELFIGLGVVLLILIIIYFVIWLILYLKVKKSYDVLDVYLKRRHELSNSYLELIYDSFLQDQSALIAVNDIKNKLNENVSLEEYFELNIRLSDEFRVIFSAVLNYPELRSKENFDNIQNELSDLETKIDNTRNIYNDKSKNYNFRMSRFPFKMFKLKDKLLYITKYDRFNIN